MVEHEEMGRTAPGQRESTKAEIRVVGLPGDRLGEAADFLARCFRANPNFVDIFPDERVRARALPLMFAAGLRDALGFGHVYAAIVQNTGSAGDDLVGLAAWLAPGAFPLSVARRLRALPRMAAVMAAAPRSARRLLGYTAGIERLHPAQPYWYLEVVGVDPSARGFGLGTRLLRPVLALANGARQPCYLETMTERNVAWYRGMGFEVREAGVRFIPGGPPNWTMIRPPVRDRAAHDRRFVVTNGEGEAAS